MNCSLIFRKKCLRERRNQLISIFHFYILFVIGELYTTIKSH